MSWFGSTVSAVGSFFSGAISAACSLGSSLVSGISSFASKVGGVIGAALENFSAIISEIPTPVTIIDIVKGIVDVIEYIGKKLGLIDKEESAEELGFKAEEAEKKPDDFKSTEEYINYLRNEIEIDKQKFDNLSEEEKLTFNATGSVILAKGVAEKKGVDIDSKFLVEVAKQKMKGEEVEAYIDNFKKSDLKMSDMTKFLKSELSPEENSKVESTMIDTMKELNSGMSDEEALEKIEEMSDISVKDFE